MTYSYSQLREHIKCSVHLFAAAIRTRLLTFQVCKGCRQIGVSKPVLDRPRDYICNDCKKSFETVLTLAEHDKERISCPHCGSKNVEQEAAAFFAMTGKKS